jgi:hypothetical protein
MAPVARAAYGHLEVFVRRISDHFCLFSSASRPCLLPKSAEACKQLAETCWQIPPTAKPKVVARAMAKLRRRRAHITSARDRQSEPARESRLAHFHLLPLPSSHHSVGPSNSIPGPTSPTFHKVPPTFPPSLSPQCLTPLSSA